MRNFFILLKIRWDESFDFSRIRHSKEKGEKTGLIVYKLIRLMIFVAAFAGITYLYHRIGEAGLYGTLPTMSYLLASVISFLVITVNMNEILTGNEDSEFLLSTPISEVSYVLIMFGTLYLRSFVYVLLFCLPAGIVYGAYAPMTAGYVVTWVIGLLITSLPMGGIAALIGMFITLSLVEQPNKNQIQSGISLGCVGIGGALVLLIVDKLDPILKAAALDPETATADMITFLTKNFRFVRMYHRAIVEQQGIYLVLFIVVSLVWYFGFSFVVGMSYRVMIISLKMPVAYKEYDWREQKVTSLKKALFRREIQQYIRSKSYFAKSMSGMLMGLMVAANLCIVGSDILFSYLKPWQIPFVICLFIGISNTTYCALSIEGKRHWIMEAAPMDEKMLFYGKVMVNLVFAIPFSIISAVLLIVALKPSLGAIMGLVVIPIVYAFINAYWGILMDRKFGSYEKESEQQAMHQGLSYVFGYLPGVIVPILLLAL